MSRVMLNCWLVAMWLWLIGHCRQYAWVRRSHSFGGLIPHFGIAESRGWKMLRVIEYVPPKRKLWSRDNWLIGFRGTYRVYHFRLIGIARHESKEQAMLDLYWRGVR